MLLYGYILYFECFGFNAQRYSVLFVSFAVMSVIFQVICLASQATGPQLPHMGRAFTDVQEMRQVIWQAFVMGWEVG